MEEGGHFGAMEEGGHLEVNVAGSKGPNTTTAPSVPSEIWIESDFLDGPLIAATPSRREEKGNVAVCGDGSCVVPVDDSTPLGCESSMPSTGVRVDGNVSLTNTEKAPAKVSDPIFGMFHPIETEGQNDDNIVAEPGPYDIICGRNNGAFNCVGNRRFRVTIEMNLHRYVDSPSPEDRANVIHSIVGMLQASGARFLKKEVIEKSSGTARYIIITKEQVRDKVTQSLRQLAHKRKRQNALFRNKSDPLIKKQKLVENGFAVATATAAQQIIGNSETTPDATTSSLARLMMDERNFGTSNAPIRNNNESAPDVATSSLARSMMEERNYGTLNSLMRSFYDDKNVPTQQPQAVHHGNMRRRNTTDTTATELPSFTGRNNTQAGTVSTKQINDEIIATFCPLRRRATM